MRAVEKRHDLGALRPHVVLNYASADVLAYLDTSILSECGGDGLESLGERLDRVLVKTFKVESAESHIRKLLVLVFST